MDECVIFPTGRLAKGQAGMHHDQAAAEAEAALAAAAEAAAAAAAASNCAKGKAPASEGVLSVGDNALKNGGETEGWALLVKTVVEG